MDGPRAAVYTAFIFSRRIRIFCTTINMRPRGAAYTVVIDSFERDVLHLQLGGTLPLADIARIEELDD